MIQKFKDWKRHHSIEFFGVCLATLLSLLVINCGSIMIYASKVDMDTMSNNAFYSEHFLTSLSGVQGNIMDVYTNDAGTKCAIMVKLDEPMKVSSDANDYQLYYKGYNISKGGYTNVTLNSPKGGYYVFGTTGYAMIYLTDSSGFANQAVEIVVQGNNTLTTTSSTNEEIMNLRKMAANFSQHDCYRIVVNPAASNTTKVSFLDNEPFDVVELFQESVVNAEEDKVRTLLAEDVTTLNDYMKQIQNYKKNLQSLSVMVPALPEEVNGDSFSNDDMLNNDYTKKASADESKEAALIYTPSYVADGGVDFDWAHNTLHDTSFLADFVQKTGKTESAFIASLGQSKSTYKSVSTSGWTMLDGTAIDFEQVGHSNLDNLKSIHDNIAGYTEVLNKYLQLKQRYQTVDMVSYLELEFNMLNSGKTFTSNYSEGTITVW